MGVYRREFDMRRITILALLAVIGTVAGCQTVDPPKPDPRRCNWRMEDAGICPLPPLFWRG
jgi:hypothetical protein